MKKKCVIIPFIVLFIDQLIKYLITSNFSLYEEKIIINNFFSLLYVRNIGAGFSILSGEVLFLAFISLAIIIGIIYYLIKDKNIKKLEYILYLILIGGILGNLIDRVVRGYVVDYLSFNFFEYSYPVFNFADICIVISIINSSVYHNLKFPLHYNIFRNKG